MMTLTTYVLCLRRLLFLAVGSAGNRFVRRLLMARLDASLHRVGLRELLAASLKREHDRNFGIFRLDQHLGLARSTRLTVGGPRVLGRLRFRLGRAEIGRLRVGEAGRDAERSGHDTDVAAGSRSDGEIEPERLTERRRLRQGNGSAGLVCARHA